ALIVVPVGVAAVDDRVALVQQVGELGDRRLGDVARRHHQPDHPRLVELGDELLERGRALRAVTLRGGDRVRVRVEGDDLVVRIALDAMDHVAAHLAEADESDLHVYSCSLIASMSPTLTRTAGRPWLRSVWRSPSAWARISVAKVYGSPGISRSSVGSSMSCRNRPVF